MRSAKVNDIVRSFVFGVRMSKHPVMGDWPFPILGYQWENAMRPIKAPVLAPFTIWAYATLRNYLVANRHIVLLASFLRDLDEEEQDYAASLMHKYYLPGVNINVCV